MHVLLKLGLCALVLSCGKVQEQQKSKKVSMIDTSLFSVPHPDIRKAYVKPKFDRKVKLSKISVRGIFSLYDSVYHKPDMMHSLLLEPNDIKYRHFETAFDTSGVYNYYGEHMLNVVEYINPEYAAFAFRKMYDLIDEGRNNQLERYYTDEGLSVEFQVLSKSGILYLLKDNYIISRFRACNDNWKKTERLENEFIQLLYPQKPENKWKIGLCCSCPQHKWFDMQ